MCYNDRVLLLADPSFSKSISFAIIAGVEERK